MRYQIFSDNEWLYPDSEIGAPGKAELFAARGGDVCFQALIDRELAEGDDVSFSFALDEKGIVFIDDSGAAQSIIAEIQKTRKARERYQYRKSY